MTEANNLIHQAQSNAFPTERMGPHFVKYHLPDGRVLHHFTSHDGGAIHDHPWSFGTTILRGGYLERAYTPTGSYTSYARREGASHYVPAETIHTIVALLDQDCWTIIEPEPASRETRFYRFNPVTGIFVSRQWDEDWCSDTAWPLP